RSLLFHGEAVGTSGPRGECRVEVEVKSLVLGKSIVRDIDHSNLMVAFKVNETRIILVQEVIRNHESLVVAAQYEVVRSGVFTKADNRQLFQIGTVRGVEQADLPGLEQAENQPVAALWSRQKLSHSSGHRSVYMRCYCLAVERRHSRAGNGIDQI